MKRNRPIQSSLDVFLTKKLNNCNQENGSSKKKKRTVVLSAKRYTYAIKMSLQQKGKACVFICNAVHYEL